nr:MAG TPA: hypothetical protein [Caudoviricetes sp.]
MTVWIRREIGYKRFVQTKLSCFCNLQRKLKGRYEDY